MNDHLEELINEYVALTGHQVSRETSTVEGPCGIETTETITLNGVSQPLAFGKIRMAGVIRRAKARQQARVD